MPWWGQAILILAAACVVALGTYHLIGARLLVAQDRARILHLIAAVESLTAMAEAGQLSNQRIEDAAAVVAADLQLSHDRADAVERGEGHPGEAADAASRSGEPS